MPLDAITVHALASELSEAVTGARIDKIQQPERDMLIFSMRCLGTNRKLLIASGTGNARVHLTTASFDNPIEPPMFCMLMRKHLTGAKIVSVTQPGFERLIAFELETYDELGVSAHKKMIVELMGRNSNLILVGADGIIIDCIRRMSFAGDETRCLQPGMIYRFPPRQNKTDFFSCDISELEYRIKNADSELTCDKWLMDSFSGLSPLICRELSHRCEGSFDNLYYASCSLRESVENSEYQPCIVYEREKPIDFSFMPLTQYEGSCTSKFFDSFSGILDSFWSERDRIEQQRRRSQNLRHSVRTIRDRIQRKLNSQYEELKRSEDRESVRRSAELVTANIYRLKKGQAFLECENYYEDGCPVIRISLDPLKTPQQNSAALFKQYNKLKGAYQHLNILIAENEKQLDYLNSVLNEIDLSENEKDISYIRLELECTGYLKKRKDSRKNSAGQRPLSFMSKDGYEILVGKNNAQNDELTCKTARRTDLWLHTRNVHGSHVIIRCDDTTPPESTIIQAAGLAAYYSRSRDSGKTAVDFTMIKNVKKPSGALPGKVIYTDYSTILVDPQKI